MVEIVILQNNKIKYKKIASYLRISFTNINGKKLHSILYKVE